MKRFILSGFFAVLMTLTMFGCSADFSYGDHFHFFDKEKWSYDTVQHWHPPKCGCKDDVAEKENHSFKETTQDDNPAIKIKTCTICKYEIVQKPVDLFESHYDKCMPAEFGSYKLVNIEGKDQIKIFYYNNDECKGVEAASEILSVTKEEKKWTAKSVSGETEISVNSYGQIIKLVLALPETNGDA